MDIIVRKNINDLENFVLNLGGNIPKKCQILQPMTLIGRIIKNQLDPKFEKPEYLIYFEIDKLNFKINKSQYDSLTLILTTVNKYFKFLALK